MKISFVSSTARWESCGIPSAEIDHLDDCITGFRTQRFRSSGESRRWIRAFASKMLLGSLSDTALGGLSFGRSPIPGIIS